MKLNVPSRLYPIADAATPAQTPLNATTEGIYRGVVFYRGEKKEGVGVVTPDSIVLASFPTESTQDFQGAIPATKFKQTVRGASDGPDDLVKYKINLDNSTVVCNGQEVAMVSGSNHPPIVNWADIDKCEAKTVKTAVVSAAAIRRVVAAVVDSSSDQEVDLTISIIETKDGVGYVTFVVGEQGQEKIIGLTSAQTIQTEVDT